MWLLLGIFYFGINLVLTRLIWSESCDINRKNVENVLTQENTRKKFRLLACINFEFINIAEKKKSDEYH